MLFQNISSWAWRDGSVSKTLAAKCGDQSSDPQNTCKCQVGMVDHLLCPLAGSRKEKKQSKLASQTSHIRIFMIQLRDPVSMNIAESNLQRLSMWAWNLQTHEYAYSYVHIPHTYKYRKRSNNISIYTIRIFSPALFWGWVSLYNLDWPKACGIDQVSLELTAIHLPPLPKC